MSSEFRRGSEVPGISEVHDVDRGWLLRPGSSRILSANVMQVLWDITLFSTQILVDVFRIVYVFRPSQSNPVLGAFELGAARRMPQFEPIFGCFRTWHVCTRVELV